MVIVVQTLGCLCNIYLKIWGLVFLVSLCITVCYIIFCYSLVSIISLNFNWMQTNLTQWSGATLPLQVCTFLFSIGNSYTLLLYICYIACQMVWIFWFMSYIGDMVLSSQSCKLWTITHLVPSLGSENLYKVHNLLFFFVIKMVFCSLLLP